MYEHQKPSTLKIKLDTVLSKCYTEASCHRGEAAMMDDQVKVAGLSKLLLTVAERLENGIDGLLNKELLISSAAKIEALEAVASIASSMIASVPRKAKGKTLKRSLVHRDEVIALSTALREAGYPTKNYV
jgi:hypothetical protein